MSGDKIDEQARTIASHGERLAGAEARANAMETAVVDLKDGQKEIRKTQRRIFDKVGGLRDEVVDAVVLAQRPAITHTCTELSRISKLEQAKATWWGGMFSLNWLFRAVVLVLVVVIAWKTYQIQSAQTQAVTPNTEASAKNIP